MLRDFEKEKLAGDDERSDIFTNDRKASIYSTYSSRENIQSDIYSVMTLCRSQS